MSSIMIQSGIQAIGRRTGGFLADTGALWRLLRLTLVAVMVGPFRGNRIRLHATLVQATRGGVDSLPLVGLIVFLVGMIVALQSAYQLESMGAASLVADLVAIIVTRELAPLLTAIIVAGRIGSAIAAELGTMKVTQEIDALTVMGIDPVPYLVAPRILGLLLALPALIIFADLAGILGGMVVAMFALGFGGQGYLIDTVNALQMEDIVTGLVKAGFFAVIIALVGCHKGLSTRGSANEVGRSTTSSVVQSITLIITADLFVTAFFYLKG